MASGHRVPTRAPRRNFLGLGDTAPMRTAVVEVRSIVGMLVAGEWALLDRLTPGSPVSASDLRSAVIDYGRTLVIPPTATFAELDAIEVEGASPRTLDVRIPMWTVEEGRSDLQLVMTLKEVAGGVWDAEVDGLYVP
jgi:hypothetical protein